MKAVRIAKDAYHKIINTNERVNQISEHFILGGGRAERSYAQWGEDILIYKLFSFIQNEKTFIDIGAHHPFRISNTALMHLNGWKGINIEPNPVLFQEFERLRPYDINLCCGVAGKEGNMPFYVIDDQHGRNSFDKSAIEEYIKDEKLSICIQKVIDVDVVTLEHVIDRYANDKCPDYMTIDTENLEYEILCKYDLKCNGPKVLTMEISSEKKKLIEMMEHAGYFLYIKIASNYTWVKNDYKRVIME